MSGSLKEQIYFYSNISAYHEFSNTYVCSFHLDGLGWLSVEHYFVYHKTFDEREKAMVRGVDSPFHAMSLGRKFKLRSDWEDVREEVMARAMYAKFKQNNYLKELLLSTGDKLLNEKSSHDYWGCKGKNRMGKILMEVRNIIKGEEL